MSIKSLSINRLDLLSASIVLLLTVFVLSLNGTVQRAYADGLTQENLPPASLGNREGSLFVKISPPIYTTATEGDAYMQFRLFDAKTNETVQHVTYDITVNKGANPVEGGKPLVRDFFHAHNGLLTLKVEPTNGSLTIFGDRDPFQAAYVADPGGTINLRGPVLQEGGLYRIDVQIFGVDNDRNIFVPDDAPKFETFLSVGDVFNFDNLTYEGKPFNTTLISYYDKIDDFNFNSTTGDFSWSMPFYYDVQRLEENPIFVHEEIKLPKDLFGSSIFNATVNGQPISGRTLAIDPFTSPEAVILHYLINKNDVIKIANEWQQKQRQETSTTPSTQPVSLERGENSGGGTTNNQNASGVMEFTLKTTQPGAPGISTNGTTTQGQPGPAAAGTSSSVNATSTDLLSDTGGIHVNVMWSPSPVRANTESSAKFNFTDAFSGGALNADVLYDISALDSNGEQVFEKKGLTAMNSQDTQSIRFPADGTYQLVLSITGLQAQPDQESGTPPPVDRTRNGIARGSVVVLEQPGQATTTTAGAPSPAQSNVNLTEQQQQNQTTAMPSEQLNNSLTAQPEPPSAQQPQQQPQSEENQTVAESQSESEPSNGGQTEQEQQNPFEQLGQAISNIFGGGGN
ncbi:MAG: hypothetical protein ACRD8W_04110 [Nitrososphaeraceae archaeon]